ncbi:hypothetical protein [Bacteroides ovatus]|uniref:hypothetical protein n=1 Tax=Bacteroides ovatus TaxID=28116 RepID=UPI0020A708C5|nr:hypothetical protein [Bacteroides ovatus]CAG9894929.1 hypothetical protein BOVA713_1891 [Bacteroides ovatus]
MELSLLLQDVVPLATSAYKWGKQNGEIRERARFNEPVALAYDEETKTFYVGDTGNL